MRRVPNSKMEKRPSNKNFLRSLRTACVILTPCGRYIGFPKDKMGFFLRLQLIAVSRSKPKLGRPYSSGASEYYLYTSKLNKNQYGEIEFANRITP